MWIELKGNESARISPALWVTFIICFLCSYSAGFISTLMAAYLPDVVSDLGREASEDILNRIGAGINALYLVGWAFGGFIWGWISDRLGRTKALAAAAMMLGTFTIMLSISTSWEMVVILRFLAGFASGGTMVVTPVLLSENWPEKTRAIIIGVDSIGFPIGIISSGLLTAIVVSWRTAFLSGALPLSIGILAFVVWRSSLMDHQRDYKPELVSDHERSILRKNLIIGAVIFSSMLIGLWGMFLWIPSWIQQLPGLPVGQTERGASLIVLGAGGLAGGFISGWVSNALGVRRAMMLCFAGCLVMSFVLFGTNDVYRIVVFAELGLLAVFFGISQGLLSIYIPMLFPVRVRGFATGFCFNIGRFATALAVFFVGVLVSFFGGYGQTLMAFSGIFAAGFIAIAVSLSLDKK